jgi:quinol monooxygenase YgiN
MTGAELVVVARLQGRPDCREAVGAILASAAAASRCDDGCLAYSFTRDVEDPDRYLSVEHWRDQAALDGHLASAHLAASRARLRGLLAGPAVVDTFSIVPA